LPVRVRPREGGAVVDWVHFDGRRLTEPSYEDSVARAGGYRLGNTVSTRLQDLPRAAPHGLSPTGFVFHMSRCGSTLAAQMLAASPSNIVVAEAPPIDALVRLEDETADRVALLRAMVAALGQVRNEGETRYFVKLDSWHTRALPLFRQAFPTTPWVFLYRDPAAVMVSHARRTGMQMVSSLVAPRFYGLDPTGRTWGEGYVAQVLGAICEGALEAYSSGGGLLVNYDELPEAVWTRILSHFGVVPSAAEREEMAAAAAFDAKSPGSRFTPDVEAKRRATTATIAAEVGRHLAEVYRRLEATRGA
jgi:hypothetical protein